jgi:hypothetical protein
MPSEERREALTCKRCGVVVEHCAFCERGECPEAICYRCLRIACRQALGEPHAHGG